MSSPVYVLDSSAVFHIKTEVAADQQWNLFERMKELVIEGRIAIARQVINEARVARHHDGPEIWFLGVAPHLRHPKECSLEKHAMVMQQVGSRLVDPDSEGDPADPYVAALALDLEAAGYEAVVVTDDYIDRPPMISLTSACSELGIATWRLCDFLREFQPSGRSARGSASDPT